MERTNNDDLSSNKRKIEDIKMIIKRICNIFMQKNQYKIRSRNENMPQIIPTIEKIKVIIKISKRFY
jgi:hypothetical protein